MPARSNSLKNIHVTTQMQNIYVFFFSQMFYEIGEAILYFQFLKFIFNLCVKFGLYILLSNVLCALRTQICVSIVLQVQRYESLDLKPSNLERITFMTRCQYKAIFIVRAYGI